MGLSSTCSCTLFSMHSTGQPLHEPCCVEVYLHINMQFDSALCCQVLGVQIQGFQMPDVNAIGK